ncbi:MAG: DNA-deoxyinosine glycosylase [Eubacteriales bacterium]|nr:DNA-deoxyinosine glycosylase [Eubacteriales bacterium]MDD4475074.1 DNA-deoxyinosine glycosylase [Eubacteriales bacterium]
MRSEQFHTIKPFFNADSKVLILGSFPSPASRDVGFFYGHPQNRFWRVLAAVFSDGIPEPLPDTESKKRFLQKNKIAMWDVLASCEIIGASDSSIRNPVPNDLKMITEKCSISAIFTTGQVATKLYRKFFYKNNIALPSPSAANAATSEADLIKSYSVIKKYLAN